MNLHDRLSTTEAYRLEREVRLVCAHCRQPATRDDIFGTVYVRHTFDTDAAACLLRTTDGPDWIWLAPTIGGFRMETR